MRILSGILILALGLSGYLFLQSLAGESLTSEQVAPQLVLAPTVPDEPGPPMVTTTPAEVREVITYARGAGPAQIDTLRKMALESKDPIVVGNALRALGRLHSIANDAELLALVDDERPRVREEAVRALGLSNDDSVVPVLADVLKEDDRDLRVLCIRSLGHIGGEQASALLADIRDDAASTEMERVFVRQALAEASKR